MMYVARLQGVGESMALCLLRKAPGFPMAGWRPAWQASLDLRSGALAGGEVAMLFAYFQPPEYVPGRPFSGWNLGLQDDPMHVVV